MPSVFFFFTRWESATKTLGCCNPVQQKTWRHCETNATPPPLWFACSEEINQEICTHKHTYTYTSRHRHVCTLTPLPLRIQTHNYSQAHAHIQTTHTVTRVLTDTYICMKNISTQIFISSDILMSKLSRNAKFDFVFLWVHHITPFIWTYESIFHSNTLYVWEDFRRVMIKIPSKWAHKTLPVLTINEHEWDSFNEIRLELLMFFVGYHLKESDEWFIRRCEASRREHIWNMRCVWTHSSGSHFSQMGYVKRSHWLWIKSLLKEYS